MAGSYTSAVAIVFPVFAELKSRTLTEPPILVQELARTVTELVTLRLEHSERVEERSYILHPPPARLTLDPHRNPLMPVSHTEQLRSRDQQREAAARAHAEAAANERAGLAFAPRRFHEAHMRPLIKRPVDLSDATARLSRGASPPKKRKSDGELQAERRLHKRRTTQADYEARLAAVLLNPPPPFTKPTAAAIPAPPHSPTDSRACDAECSESDMGYVLWIPESPQRPPTPPLTPMQQDEPPLVDLSLSPAESQLSGAESRALMKNADALMAAVELHGLAWLDSLRDERGWTALHHAAAADSPALLEWLLAHGAAHDQHAARACDVRRVSSKPKFAIYAGATPLMVAVARRRLAAVERLLLGPASQPHAASPAYVQQVYAHERASSARRLVQAIKSCSDRAPFSAAFARWDAAQLA